MKSIIFQILKVIILLSLFIFLYYLFLIRPKIILRKNALAVQKELSLHHSTLVQNRLAFVELTHLNPTSASFDIEKSNLVGTLKKTSEDGLRLGEASALDSKALEIIKKLLNLEKLKDRFPSLLEDTKKIYQDQNSLLEKVFATKSYQEGVAILKSDEAVKLLTQETNLILEYEYWLKRVDNSK